MILEAIWYILKRVLLLFLALFIVAYGAGALRDTNERPADIASEQEIYDYYYSRMTTAETQSEYGNLVMQVGGLSFKNYQTYSDVFKRLNDDTELYEKYLKAKERREFAQERYEHTRDVELPHELEEYEKLAAVEAAALAEWEAIRK